MRSEHFLFGVPIMLALASCGDGDYYSEADFQSVAKIDTHIHINVEDDALDRQAAEDNFMLLDINVDAPHYPLMTEQRRLGYLHATRQPASIKWLTSFTLDSWNSKAWTPMTIAGLDSSFRQGALGIKVWKNIGMVHKDSAGNFVMIDNPRFDSVMNFVVASGKVVMGHLGEPKNCWLPLDQMTVKNDRSYFESHPQYHMFLHPDFPSYEDQIQARDNFIARHPDMIFVGAHMGSIEWNLDSLAVRLDRFPNMAVDLARIPNIQYLTVKDRDAVRSFFIKYQDRLTYATDIAYYPNDTPGERASSAHRQWIYHWKYFVTDEPMTAPQVEGEFRGLKLPREVIDKIYHHNAVRWFGIKQ